MPLRILVTGGAGFVGRAVCRTLLREGHPVRSLDLEACDVPGVESLCGDIRDPAALRRAAEDTGAIVHAAAALPLWPPGEIESINVTGTRFVFEAARALGIPRIVHLSTTAVYGIPDRGPLLESDPLSATDVYSKSKIEAEDVARSFRGTVCAPILRAKLVTGPGRLGIFDVIFDWTRRGKHIPILGDGANRYQMLHVDDLAAAVVLALSAPDDRADDIYNVAAERFGTVREDFQALLDHAGHARRVILLPMRPATKVLRLLEFLKLSPLSSSVFAAAGKTSFVSVAKARTRLGWTPIKSNVEALIESYDWYLAHHREFAGRTGVTHRSTLRQGALALVRFFF